jgi:hypothetical protein
MKIKPEHYQHMLQELKRVCKPERIAAHKQFIIFEGKARDIEMRLRWDMSYYAGLSPWISANVYPYADDSHVDTALRAIMKELAV